jgi:uncharacterized protein YkwD
VADGGPKARRCFSLRGDADTRQTMPVKAVFLACIFLFLFVRPGVTAPASSSPASPSDLEQIERLTNQLRTARGLVPLRLDASLCRAATSHALDMAQNHYFAHTRRTAGPFGESTPGSRASAEGYRWGFIAENIACGQQTGVSAFLAWVRSRPHYHNLVSPAVRELGIGIARNRQTNQPYWVMMLGSRQESFAPPSEFMRVTFGPVSPFGF